MGILGLAPFLQKTCPNVFKVFPERLKAFAGKTIAMDGTLMTQRFHFAQIPHHYRHMLGWYRIIKELDDAGVQAIVVFDGDQRHAAKKREVARRRQVRQVEAVRGAMESERLRRLQEVGALLSPPLSLDGTQRVRNPNMMKDVVIAEPETLSADAYAFDMSWIPFGDLTHIDVEQIWNRDSSPAVTDTDSSVEPPYEPPLEPPLEQVSEEPTVEPVVPSPVSQPEASIEVDAHLWTQDPSPPVHPPPVTDTESTAEPLSELPLEPPLEQVSEEPTVEPVVPSGAPQPEGPIEVDAHLWTQDPSPPVQPPTVPDTESTAEPLLEPPLEQVLEKPPVEALVPSPVPQPEEPIKVDEQIEIAEPLYQLGTHIDADPCLEIDELYQPDISIDADAQMEIDESELLVPDLPVAALAQGEDLGPTISPVDRDARLAALYKQYQASAPLFASLPSTSRGTSTPAFSELEVAIDPPVARMEDESDSEPVPDGSHVDHIQDAHVDPLLIPSTNESDQSAEDGVEYAMSRAQNQLAVEEGRFWHAVFNSRLPLSELQALTDKSGTLFESYQRRTNPPTYQTYEECRFILKALGVPCILSQGPFEAEALAASLVVHGYADYVATEDTDVLLYEVPMIRNLSTKNDPLQLVSSSEIRQSLALTPSGFLDFALLLGTDFSQRIKNIGPARALKFIRQHHSIENIVTHEGARFPPRLPADAYLEEVQVARSVFSSLPPPPNPSQLRQNEADDEAVMQLLQEYGLLHVVSSDMGDEFFSFAHYLEDQPD